MKTVRFLQFLLYSVIIAGVYFIFEDLARLKLNTADASTYLNIAWNIVSHKGFVVSFNLYQFFKTHYYPIWPYMQAIYPLLCSLVFKFHGGIEQVIKVNIFILALNSALVFYIIQRLILTRLNMLFLFWLVLSFNFFISALYAWTEQLHLFLFLISFILFLRFPKNPRVLVWVGVLNGVLFLVRVAQIYNILAFLAVICITDRNIREKFKDIMVFIAGFLTVVIPFQLFNLAVYHAFYPQYIKPAADYTLARISQQSYYKEGELGIFNPSGFKFSMDNIWYFHQHMFDFYIRIYLFIIPVMAYFSVPQRKKRGEFFVINCVLQSFFIITCYSYNFCWNTSIDSLRYSLIPFVLMAMAGWYCFYELFYFPGIVWKRLFVLFLMINLAFYSLDRYYSFYREAMSHPREKNPYYNQLYESYRWIDQHLPQNILIASNEDQEGFFMRRPFISTPPNKSYNCSNLAVYNRNYAPDYYLMSSLINDDCFAQIPHTVIYSNKIFRLLKVKKSKT